MTTIYRSTDGSAPVLTGSVGTLTALLTACLVNGYGSKSAAGWTNPFHGTNQEVYKQGAGSGFYCQVDDAGPGAGGAREVRTWGYETMTAYNTSAVTRFPNAAAGTVVRKSTTADGTARAWILAADAATFHLFCFTGDAANTFFGTSFGDIYSVLVADAYKCAIFGRQFENAATLTSNAADLAIFQNTTGSSSAGRIARSYTGAGGSVEVVRHGDISKYHSTTIGGGTSMAAYGVTPFPNPADGGLYTAPITVCEAATNPVVRGVLRGLRHCTQPLASFAAGDTFDGQGADAGRSFEIVRQSATGSQGSNGFLALETTAWDSSV